MGERAPAWSWLPLRPVVVLVVILLLVVFATLADATVWDTRYFTRGDASVASPWCVDGHYLLLKAPGCSRPRKAGGPISPVCSG